MEKINKEVGRIDSVDSLAGLLIINMIAYHCIQNAGLGDSPIFMITYPLYFFMPWFFFKAGVFYKRKTISACITGGGKKLLVPFLCFSLIGHIVYCIHMYLNNDNEIVHYIFSPIKQILLFGSCSGNPPLWFLISLFFVKIIYNLLSKIGMSSVIVFALFAVISLFFNKFPFFKILSIINICSGLAFYSLGHLLRDRQNDKFFLCLSISIYGYSALCGWTIIDMHANRSIIGNYLFWIPTSLAGIIVFNKIFNYLNDVPYLNCVGKNSMYFYVLHWIIILIVKIILLDVFFVVNRYLILFVMVLSEMMLLPLAFIVLSKNRFRWLVGN